MIGESSVQVPTNWKSNIDQVVAGYDTQPAKGLVHGFQKDAIQNGWGAKKYKTGKDWGIRFQLTQTIQGTFLTVEDFGTVGMTGPNMSMDQINNLSGDLDPDYRLARFSAMNYSGGNEGPGLFGRGKLLFSAASKDYHFYFETLTENEGYRANYKKLNGNMLNIGKKAFEGSEAREFIHQNTGLEPINKVGSRIIVVNPKDEIVDAINNGDFLRFIEETWWRIILKYDANITVEYKGEVKKAQVPPIYLDAIKEKKGWKAWTKTNFTVTGYHQVKRIQLFVSEHEIDEDLLGVFFYRKDMKIGEIDLEIPNKIQKKYFGFIEVDNNWENELTDNENLEHYGVKNKSKKCYQKLKITVNNEHKLFMEDLGLIKKKESEDQRLRQELSEISQGLDSFFNSMNIGNLGNSGLKKEPIEVSWAGLIFPSSSRNNIVYTGDYIKNIKFKIKNNTGSTKNIEYKLFVSYHNQEVLSIAKGARSIQGSSEETFGPFNDLLIDVPLVRFEKNIIILEVTYRNKKIVKQIPLYYDTTSVTTPRHNFVLKNLNITYPQPESKRVNTNDKLTNIVYTIENNTSEKAYIAFHLSTHNVEQSNELLQSIIITKDIVLDPFNKIEINCPDIYFDKERYESKMGNGKIEIRARISAAQDFLDYEMADELTKGSKITVYLNQDPDGIGSGTFSDFRSRIEEIGKKSDVDSENENLIFELYIKHPSYERVVDDEENRKEYLAEEMLKQMVRAQIEGGNYSILNLGEEQEKSQEEFEALSSVELMQKTLFVIDKLNFNRLKNKGVL